MEMKRWIYAAGMLALFAGVTPRLSAEQYALIVGAGKFPNLVDDKGHPASDLDGARPDAEKLAELLMRYGYSRANINLLVDTQATRAAILNGIDQLIARVKAGDQVIIYYSGHGTSSLDTKTHGFGMEPATGAVVPSDIKPGTAEQILAQLVIGTRDLRPRFLRLEEKADVLVIFDACFSGESVKALGPSMPLRYISLADLTRGDVTSSSIVAAERALPTRAVPPAYPYQRVVYFAAASNNQYAIDINRNVLSHLQGRFNTVDGLPHGAFTNVLLKLFADPAAAGPASCHAIFDRAASLVREQGKIIDAGQDPQLLYPPANTKVVEKPCFTASTQPTQPQPQPHPGGPTSGIREQIDSIAAHASFKIACKLSQPSYHAGQSTVMQCTVPEPGFLNIISYGDGDDKAVQLLPNDLERSSAVPAGTSRVPNGKFNIDNYLPAGQTHQQQVMLVIFSKEQQDLKSLGAPEGIFTGLTERALRSQRVTPAGAGGYGAAELVFEITK